MTTNASYLVAYPHPSIHPRVRVRLLTVDSQSTGETILAKSREFYPELVGDLDPRGVEYYMVNRPSTT